MPQPLHSLNPVSSHSPISIADRRSPQVAHAEPGAGGNAAFVSTGEVVVFSVIIIGVKVFCQPRPSARGLGRSHYAFREIHAGLLKTGPPSVPFFSARPVWVVRERVVFPFGVCVPASVSVGSFVDFHSAERLKWSNEAVVPTRARVAFIAIARCFRTLVAHLRSSAEKSPRC